MRMLVAVAASILVSTGALACEMDKAAQTPPDPSIAAKKDPPAQVADVKTKKATTFAATKTKKDPTIAASSVPKPVYFASRKTD
jgi:hypothetical protein